jgi:hypothetical protein
MPITIPTVAFDSTNTIIPRKTYLTLTPTVAGVAGTPVSIPGKVAEYGDAIETTTRDVPDADGFLRPDREVPKTRKQTLKFEVEDVKTLGGAFGGATVEGGLAKGTAELFVVDPDDAANKLALHSNVFKASWKIDGGMKLNTGELSKVTLLINALEKVTLTPDVTTA